MARTVQMLPASMASLPTFDSSALPPDAGALAAIPAGLTRPDDEQFLLRAFRSFAAAAGSLEHSYGLLRAEVARLHGELEQSHAGLERSLEENRRMREHVDRILEGLPCGVLVVDDDGEISRANPEARKLLQLNPGTFPVALETLPGNLRQLLQRAQSMAAEQEECLPDSDGGKRWLALRHAAVGESVPRSSIFILRDVSQAKELEQQRERQQRERALAEMSAMLAHEIRNPLASLELFAELLAGAGISGECRAWVEHVQAGLRTLAATVNNVLHFHSLPPPERAPTDLGELLDWAASFLAPVAHQARVKLSLDNRLRGVRVAVDRHRLEQVLLNLVLNAVRAMPEGGRVEMSGNLSEGETEDEAEGVTICVADTGHGISSEYAGQIFDPGFSTRSGSPGLGLAVCRKIAEQHGGAIEATSRMGAGAIFTLTLPVLSV